ncbi:unnamed protein product [Ectocarpus sp. 8 AP-2014]
MKTFKELPWSRISVHTSDRKQPAYATHRHTMKQSHFTAVDDSNRRPRAAPFRQRLHGYTPFHPQKESTCRPRKQDAASTMPRVPGYPSDREEAPPIAFLLSAPFPNRARKNALESAPVQSPLRDTQSAIFHLEPAGHEVGGEAAAPAQAPPRSFRRASADRATSTEPTPSTTATSRPKTLEKKRETENESCLRPQAEAKSSRMAPAASPPPAPRLQPPPSPPPSPAATDGAAEVTPPAPAAFTSLKPCEPGLIPEPSAVVGPATVLQSARGFTSLAAARVRGLSARPAETTGGAVTSPAIVAAGDTFRRTEGPPPAEPEHPKPCRRLGCATRHRAEASASMIAASPSDETMAACGGRC